MEPDFIPMIPVKGLIKLRQIEPFELGHGGDNYEYWKLRGVSLEGSGSGETRRMPGYGALYNWFAATDSRGIAPMGWHVPTLAELQTMVSWLQGSLVAGGHLKEQGTTYWQEQSAGADDVVGFSAVGSGMRVAGVYRDLKSLGPVLSVTPNGADYFYLFLSSASDVAADV